MKPKFPTIKKLIWGGEILYKISYKEYILVVSTKNLRMNTERQILSVSIVCLRSTHPSIYNNNGTIAHSNSLKLELVDSTEILIRKPYQLMTSI